VRASDEDARIDIALSTSSYAALRRSLVRERDGREYGAFLFGKPQDGGLLEVVGVELLEPRHFSSQSVGYLELRDGALQEMIARAHRSETALIEAHSHPFSTGPRVAFSPFDERGLSEVAPHVAWRLPGRPYVALVFGTDAFDGLFWASSDPSPSGAVDLIVNGERVVGSGESLLQWRRER
jgi:hypothetical protein